MLASMLSAETPVGKHGRLRVQGLQLCNERGKPVQLRGVSSHGLQWHAGCLTEESLDVLAHEWRADIIRLSMYVQEGGYETDPARFTELLHRLIEAASARGLYVLVDWHQLDPGDPRRNLELAKGFFQEVAARHRERPNLLYDICNEPNGVDWDAIHEYAMALIPVIRAVDDHAPIIVGTHGWASFGVSDGRTVDDILRRPLPFDNLLYAFHFYAASHREPYLKELDRASEALPVFVTEFGAQEASGDGANDFEMAGKFLELMQSRKISWCCWNYSDDPRTGAVWQTGTCGNGPWTKERLKESGLWIRGILRRVAGME